MTPPERERIVAGDAGEEIRNGAGRNASAVGGEVHRYVDVSSTNDVALELAALGRPEGTVVIAERQLRGRGRRGRTWHSPGGVNLYLSILLRPERDLQEWQQLSWVVAGAVALTILDSGLREALSLKCPNDILVKGRKISGVLLEKRTGGGVPPSVVAGIGVNINAAEGELPAALAGRATSLAMETGRFHELDEIIPLLFRRLWELYGLWNSSGAADVRRLLEKRGVVFLDFTAQGRCREKGGSGAVRRG